MNITDQQLKDVALAGGVKDIDTLNVERSENFFELKDKNKNSVFSIRFIIGPCVDKVEFKSTLNSFDEEASRHKMESLGLIEKL